MQKGNGRSHQFGIVKFAIILAQLVVLTATARTQAHAASDSHTIHAAAFANAPTGDVLDGITFAGTYTDADVAYLRDNLNFLRDQMPLWSQYIEEAKPLTLVVDLNEGAHGHAAVAKCCVAGNRGVITFGDHVGILADSSDADDQTPEARRIRFLVILVHETTHVRDQRAGRFLQKTNFKSCVDVEKSAFDKQLEFQQDALNIELGRSPTSTQTYREWLEQTVKIETAALKSRDLWDQYCGAFSGY